MNSHSEKLPLTVPKATVYRVAGGVALGCAIAALAVAAVFRPDLGSVIGYLILPLLLVMAASSVAFLARLRIIGFLPSEADQIIPTALQPWIRAWLVSRRGLLGAVLLVALFVIGRAVAGGPARYGVDAFVYLVLGHMFLDLVFWTVLNVAIIRGRGGAS